MSADNWGICPKCALHAVRISKKAKQQAEDSYGKVSSEEYLTLLKKHDDPIKLESTLREDYEIWTDEDGMFYVSYSCSCSECKFSFNFNHEERILMDWTNLLQKGELS